MRYEVVSAKRSDAGMLVRRLREDQKSALAMLGLKPHADLVAAFEQSFVRRAWRIDGRIAAMGGVIGTLMGATGYVWLAMSREGTRHPVAMVKEALRQLAELSDGRTLHARVPSADPAAVRFALRLGFRADADAREGIVDMTYGAPCIVFALPRSRTLWLARFMDCPHDSVLQQSSVAGMLEFLSRRGPTIETGLAAAWRLIRDSIPGVRFAVIRRSLRDVRRSAERKGWVFPEGHLETQERALDEIVALPGTLTVRFEDLDDDVTVSFLCGFCGVKFDPERWESMKARNIQLDMDERMRELVRNGPVMRALFAEIEAR